MGLLTIAKTEMLKGIDTTLTSVQLKFQDGTTNTAITEANLWTTPTTNVLNQSTAVEFSIDTSLGTKNISGFKLLFGATVGVDANFPQIYNYPNNGTFTFDGMSIVVN